MSDQQPQPEQVREIWEANAEFWDDRIGDGNQFQVELIEPATERLLRIVPGRTAVLDVACGAGRFGRRMAELGARVTGIDFCQAFLARARGRTPPGASIEYRRVDAADKAALLALGSGAFDGAVATMALMDMLDIGPLFSALPALLKPGGWFVFSICHPCFQPPGMTRFVESTDADGQFVVRHGIKIGSYLTPGGYLGIGVVGQPRPQYYFHRSLSDIFNLAFANGFVMDGFTEPRLTAPPPDGNELRWDRLSDVPPVLVVRLKKSD